MTDTSSEAVERLAHMADTTPLWDAGGEARSIGEECAAMLRALLAERDAAWALLAECAAEIEASLNVEYPHRDKYPDEMRRWDRDMDLVRRVRAAISPAPPAPGDTAP